jgi:multidrug efflux pump
MDRAISIGGPSTQWWTQLATAVAGGLAFATVLTLVLTPSLLVLGEGLKYRRRNSLPSATHAATRGALTE